MHLTLIPYIPSSGEIKTKPTQHSVKELRSIGIQPDILLCRAQTKVPDEQRRKIALFTNVEERAVISAVDADDLYKIPMLLHEEGPRRHRGRQAAARRAARRSVRVAPGGRGQDQPGHDGDDRDGRQVREPARLVHLADGSADPRRRAHPHARQDPVRRGHRRREARHELLDGVDAILVPGGFGERGIEGKIQAIQYARENRIPYLGICLGMQLAIIEYARDVANLHGAHSTEFNRSAPHPVIALISEWQDEKGTTEQRTEKSELGGTMRLGAQEVRLSHGSRAHQIYGSDLIQERHRHRYEFNNRYLQKMMNAGCASPVSRATAWSR
jgi:CTP synthase